MYLHKSPKFQYFSHIRVDADSPIVIGVNTRWHWTFAFKLCFFGASVLSCFPPPEQLHVSKTVWVLKCHCEDVLWLRSRSVSLCLLSCPGSLGSDADRCLPAACVCSCPVPATATSYFTTTCVSPSPEGYEKSRSLNNIAGLTGMAGNALRLSPVASPYGSPCPLRRSRSPIPSILWDRPTPRSSHRWPAGFYMLWLIHSG